MVRKARKEVAKRAQKEVDTDPLHDVPSVAGPERNIRRFMVVAIRFAYRGPKVAPKEVDNSQQLPEMNGGSLCEKTSAFPSSE